MTIHRTIEFNTMIGYLASLQSFFPNSFLLLRTNEFILIPKINEYFSLNDVVTLELLQTKVLIGAVHAIKKARPSSQEWRNEKFRDDILLHLNEYFGTCFTYSDINFFYKKFSSYRNFDLAYSFVESRFNYQVL